MKGAVIHTMTVPNDSLGFRPRPETKDSAPGLPYDAFISYSHARDKPVAEALQSIVQKLGKPWYSRRALRLFRDDASLAATPHLWPSIERALGKSRFLILIAAPEAAASPWVNKEVAWWLDNNSISTVLVALSDGELSWSGTICDFLWSPAFPLPPALKGRFTDEPRWIDLRCYRTGALTSDPKFAELAADFAATIRGIPKEDLLSQEVLQQRRALRLAQLAVAALVLLLILAGALWLEALHQRNVAVSRERAQTALALERSDPAAALAVALEGVTATRTVEADFALRRLLAGAHERVVVQHPGTVSGIAFSPDGARFVTKGSDGTIGVWRAPAGDLEHRLSGYQSTPWTAEFDGDGTHLLTSSTSGVAHVWETAAWTASVDLRVPGTALTRASFSRDGHYVVTVDGAVPRLWDARTGASLGNFPSHPGQITDVAFSADGSRVTTRAEDNVGRIFETRSKSLVLTVNEVGRERHKDRLNEVRMSQDGRWLVSTSVDGTARMWDGRNGAALKVLDHDGRPVIDAVYSPDSKYVITWSGSAAYVWELPAAKRIAKIEHPAEVAGVAVSPDGNWLATIAWDNVGRLWSTRTWLMVTEMRGHTNYGSAVAFAPDSRTVATGAYDGTARLWDPVPLQSILALRNDPEITIQTAPDVDTGPNPKIVLLATPDGAITLHSSESGKTVRTIGLHPSVKVARFDPSGRRIVSAGWDRVARVWDLNNNTFVPLPHPAGIEIANFSRDGRFVLTAGGSVIKIWEVSTGKELTSLSAPPGSIGAAVFTPSGDAVAFGVRDRIQIINWRLKRVILDRTQPSMSVTGLVFLGNGDRFVTTSWGQERTVRLWDVARETSVVMGQHASWIFGLAVNREGTLVATADDEKVRIWHIASRRMLLEFVGLSGARNLAFSEDGRYLAAASLFGFSSVLICDACVPLDVAVELAKTRTISAVSRLAQ